MNGTVKRNLNGALLLGVALAWVGAGCVGAPEGSEGIENAVQDLDSVVSDGDGDGAVADDDGDDGDDGALDGDAQGAGVLLTDEGEEDTAPGPDPLPWNGGRPLDSDDDDFASHPSTMTHGGPSTPSGGNSGE